MLTIFDLDSGSELQQRSDCIRKIRFIANLPMLWSRIPTSHMGALEPVPSSYVARPLGGVDLAVFRRALFHPSLFVRLPLELARKINRVSLMGPPWNKLTYCYLKPTDRSRVL
jgi:hypothetical protein